MLEKQYFYPIYKNIYYSASRPKTSQKRKSNSNSVYLWWTQSTGPFPSGGTATNQYVYVNGNLHATIPGNVNYYWVTGLSASTTYNFMVRAAGINGSSGSLSNDSNTTSGTTFASITYNPIYNACHDPCGVQYNNLYQGSDGLYYAFDGVNYNLFTGYYYNFYGPSYDVYNWYEWGTFYIDNGVSNNYGVTLSPCGLY